MDVPPTKATKAPALKANLIHQVKISSRFSAEVTQTSMLPRAPCRSREEGPWCVFGRLRLGPKLEIGLASYVVIVIRTKQV